MALLRTFVSQAFKQLEQQGETYHKDSKHSGSSRGRGSRGQAGGFGL